jgi:deoxyadenosine/deoxycytidine kinase
MGLARSVSPGWVAMNCMRRVSGATVRHHMIIAIEGASAAGKTTWCREHFPDQHVTETSENISAPELFSDPTQVAIFWVNHATENWRRALEIEKQHDVAVCDGDPLHLYFSWALWKSGALGGQLFDTERDLYRDAFAHQRIGFVDHVLWIEVSEEELHRRASADKIRRRKRHEMYLTLVPWMKAWFQERQRILPQTVHALETSLDIESLAPLSISERYEMRRFDEMVNSISSHSRFQRRD